MKYVIEGFPNEKIINYRRDNIKIEVADVYVTDIGYFPVTKLHKVDRKNGCTENIMCFCTKGKGYIQIKDAIREVNKNEYFIIPKNVSHKYFSGMSDGWGLYFVHLSGEKADTFCRVHRKVDNHLQQTQLNLIYNIIYNSILLLEIDTNSNNVQFVNLSIEYMLNALENFESNINSYTKQDELTSRFLNYLELNVSSKIGIHELTENLKVSQATLYSAIKEKYDMTPMQYVFDFKVNIAADLLITTNYKIAKIASKVGFDDQYHFSKKFKKLTGESPSEYRKSKREQ